MIHVGNGTLYPEDFDVNIATSALRHAKLEMVDLYLRRTSLKWIIHLEGGQTVLFKPVTVQNTQRESRCIRGCEHPEYEMAGFTINRLLGYRNFPFTTGRSLSWTKEVYPVATERLRNMVNLTKDGDLCYWFHCYRENRTSETAKCFKNGVIPGAMIYFLRGNVEFKAEHGRPFHPYHPSVVGDFKPKEYLQKLPGDDSYCQEFRQKRLFRTPRDFGDILDITVMSYITNHMDQKLTLLQLGSSYMHVMFDYGYAFCSDYYLKLAAPIYQCCKIRRRSFERLKELKDSFPSRFEEMTKDDPLYPLLLPDHVQIITRKIRMLLALTEYCIHFKGYENVVQDFI